MAKELSDLGKRGTAAQQCGCRGVPEAVRADETDPGAPAMDA